MNDPAFTDVYDDRFGAVIDHADAGYLEIRWYDATEPMSADDRWTEHIAPRCDAAGVKRFAFHVPDGTPAVGSSPSAISPSSFQTAYFSRRQAALDWLRP